jgi:hypothetical protein
LVDILFDLVKLVDPELLGIVVTGLLGIIVPELISGDVIG